MLLEASLGRVVVVTAVDEHVVLAAVTVQVAVEEHLAFFHELFDHLACMPYARKSLFEQSLVVAI